MEWGGGSFPIMWMASLSLLLLLQAALSVAVTSGFRTLGVFSDSKTIVMLLNSRITLEADTLANATLFKLLKLAYLDSFVYHFSEDSFKQLFLFGFRLLYLVILRTNRSLLITDRQGFII